MIVPEDFRAALAHFPTGVCVITARLDNGDLVGMAVSSFTSVSLDPPLVGFFPDRRSGSWQRARATGRFCVNLLAEEQEAVCRCFASREENKFAGIGHHISDMGLPVLDGVVATIECDIFSETEAGDHYFVLGEVRRLYANRARRPLIFFQKGYHRLPSLQA